MKPERILELVNSPDVPKFNFGSAELEEWNRKYRNPHTCEAMEDSWFYVVVHRSLNPRQRQDFRVLSRWCRGQLVPDSWAVPATADPLRYIPVAEYDIGLCHYGKTEPYKTVTVKADSLQVAMAEGRKLLKPSTVEHVRHVATRPNPEHVATQQCHRDETSADMTVFRESRANSPVGAEIRKHLGMM